MNDARRLSAHSVGGPVAFSGQTSGTDLLDGSQGARGTLSRTSRRGEEGESASADGPSVFLAAVSYTNYKKTPPPVPPRTTSKPLISVTAQSSTESTQDAYQDSRAQRMSPWPQDSRGLYNSTDSLDSNKAMSLALETAAAQRLGLDSQSGPARPGDKAILASKAEDFFRGPRSSVGIQVASLSASSPRQSHRPPRDRVPGRSPLVLPACRCNRQQPPQGHSGPRPMPAPATCRSPSHPRALSPGPLAT